MSEISYPNNNLNNPNLGTDRSATSGDAGASASVHQQALTDRVAQSAHHTIDRLVETATPHIERLEGAVMEATSQLKDQAQHVREKGDEWANDLRATVRRNPLTAVAVAVAAGALIARLKR